MFFAIYWGARNKRILGAGVRGVIFVFRHMGVLEFYFILSNNLRRSTGTTDDFAIIPFLLILFLAALAELAKYIPVHSLILFFYLFFCLPLFSFSVHCAL